MTRLGHDSFRPCISETTHPLQKQCKSFRSDARNHGGRLTARGDHDGGWLHARRVHGVPQTHKKWIRYGAATCAVTVPHSTFLTSHNSHSSKEENLRRDLTVQGGNRIISILGMTCCHYADQKHTHDHQAGREHTHVGVHERKVSLKFRLLSSLHKTAQADGDQKDYSTFSE